MFGKISIKASIACVAALTALASTANAEKYEWGNVRFDGGGFVSAIMPSPTVEGLIYARTDVGGCW